MVINQIFNNNNNTCFKDQFRVNLGRSWSGRRMTNNPSVARDDGWFSDDNRNSNCKSPSPSTNSGFTGQKPFLSPKQQFCRQHWRYSQSNVHCVPKNNPPLLSGLFRLLLGQRKILSDFNIFGRHIPKRWQDVGLKWGFQFPTRLTLCFYITRGNKICISCHSTTYFVNCALNTSSLLTIKVFNFLTQYNILQPFWHHFLLFYSKHSKCRPRVNTSAQ